MCGMYISAYYTRSRYPRRTAAMEGDHYTKYYIVSNYYLFIFRPL